MKSVHITFLEDLDEPAIQSMLVDLALEEQERYDHPRDSREAVAATTDSPKKHFVGDNHVFIARDEAGDVIGMCWCALFDPGTGLEGEVAELYVKPESRGQGIATALLRSAMELFRRENVTFAAAWTHPSNAAALRAYEAAGFTPTEQTVLTWLPLERC